jgi:hypothetical protein
MENSMEFLRNSKAGAVYDPATPCLGIYLKELKIESQRDSCIPIFITVLFTIVKR